MLLIHNHAIFSGNSTLSTYNIVLLLVLPLTSVAVNDRLTSYHTRQLHPSAHNTRSKVLELIKLLENRSITGLCYLSLK